MAFLGWFFFEQTIIGPFDLLYRATQFWPQAGAATLDFPERSVAARFCTYDQLVYALDIIDS